MHVSSARCLQQGGCIGSYVPGYTGPDDGRSHPRFPGFCRAVNRALIAGCYRLEVEGAENFPQDGAQVYCPTHPSMFDPPLVASLTERDMRYMANIRIFGGLRGKLMTWGGAFPLDREKPHVRTIKHAIEILEQGKGLCVFPEGGISDPQKDGHVGPLKKGAAYFALRGQAENIVPLAQSYGPDTRSRPGEAIAGMVLAGAVVAAGLASAHGGPVARVLGSVLTGAMAGGYALGKLQGDRTPNPEWYDPFPKYFATLTGGAVGMVLGAAASGLSAALAPETATWSALAGGLGTLGMARGWIHRDVARVVVGQPIPVEPYRQAPLRQATSDLTAEVHRRLGHLTSQLSGRPYDDSLPKFRGRMVETVNLGPVPRSAVDS